MPASIKVEHFQFDIGADGSIKTLTNDVGDLSKALVRNNTPRGMSAGPLGSSAAQNISTFSAGVQLTATNELTGYRQGSKSELIRVRGEVWRYVGPAGGPNEFVTRARGSTGTFTTLSTIIDLSSAGIVDPDRCVVFINGGLLDQNGSSQIQRVVGAGWINADGDLEIERGWHTTQVEFFYELVEFTGPNWEVGHGEAATVSAGSNTITLKQGHLFDGADFDVGDWATAAIVSAKQRGPHADDGVEDSLFTVSPGVSTTQVTVDFAPGAGLAGSRVIVHVIKHADMDVQRGSGSGAIAVGDTNYTVSGLAALDEAALEWSSYGDSGSRNHAMGAVTAHLTGLTNAQGWVHRGIGGGAWSWGAIDLSGIVDDGGEPEPHRSRLTLLGVS